MREDIVETSVVGIAEKHGWTSRKVKWIGRTGAPDRIFMHASLGRTVWIEFKRPIGGVAGPNQLREIALLKASGNEAHFGIRSILAALEILGIPLDAYRYLEPRRR